MCGIISSEPTEDTKGRIKTFHGPVELQTTMMKAPFAACPTSFCWFFGQCNPITFGCTQYALRRKVLHGDMSKYSCFQGYFNFFCIRAGDCGEQKCPEFCLFCEACICNFAAISATRMYVMDKYALSSDPCDYRLIRINNCLQVLSFICNILSICIEQIREGARLLDWIADLFFSCTSGCMTAQVAHEQNYQDSLHNTATSIPAVHGAGGAGGAGGGVYDGTTGVGERVMSSQPTAPYAPPEGFIAGERG